MERQVEGSLARLSIVPSEPRGEFDCQRSAAQQQPWRFPDVGWVKFNVDGAVSVDLQASCGGVLRDATGQWLKGFIKNMGNLSSANVFLAELTAVSTAMEIVIGLEIPQVIIESDSFELIRLINDPFGHPHQYGEIVQHIQHMQQVHGSIKFQFVNREANVLADYLAHVGHKFPLGNHLIDSPFGECHRLLSKDSSEVVSSICVTIPR